MTTWTSSGPFPANYDNSDQPNDTSQNEDKGIAQQLASINRQRAALTEQEGLLLEKGLSSYNPDILMKAQQHWNDIQTRQSSDFKSTLIDPRELSDSLGYKHKPRSISYGMLRRMARVPLIRSVITTRQTQIASFSRPQSDRFETGFRVRKKRDYYSKKEPKLSSQDKNEIKRLTDFLLKGGETMHKWHGDNFEAFLKKLVEDSLTLDQATFEVVRNRIGQPIQYLATDGATFRIAASYDDENYVRGETEQKFGYYPSFVQVIEEEVNAEYYPWELCFGVRNSSTDIYRNNYGRSELEDLIEIVTYMLSADTYNGKFFTQGSNPKGIIKVAGNVNTNRLAEFRQQWSSMVAGVMNAWKVPVLESDKMEWIDLQQKNTDMQFSQWQEYLLKVTCSVYKISPEELGFNVGNSGSGGAMFESGAEARLKYSRDKGLIPLLKQIEYWINHWIIEPLNEDFEFIFVGYDHDGKEKELEMDIKLAQNFVGWKEMRKKWEYSDELEEGDFPLNNAWIQRTGQLEMAEQMEEGQEEEEGDDFDWESIDVEKAIDIDHNPMAEDLHAHWDQLMKD